jgi:hypothetical protein
VSSRRTTRRLRRRRSSIGCNIVASRAAPPTSAKRKAPTEWDMSDRPTDGSSTRTRRTSAPARGHPPLLYPIFTRGQHQLSEHSGRRAAAPRVLHALTADVYSFWESRHDQVLPAERDHRTRAPPISLMDTAESAATTHDNKSCRLLITRGR